MMRRLDRMGYVRDELANKGFSKLPQFQLSPDAPDATRVVFLTNCCIYPVKPDVHAATKTKTYYAQTGREHLVNVTAAVALKLAERGVRTIVHLPPDVGDRIKNLFLLHPAAQLFTFVEGDVGSFEFLHLLYDVIRGLVQERPVAAIDFCLYDSYASGLKKPFLPMFEDSPEVAMELAGKRIAFMYNMSLVGYDLLANKGQAAFRLVCPTALAAKRASAHLFTDTIHKAVSHVALVTLGYEMPHYTGKPVSIVEVAPGIVDSGMYDDQSVREYTAEEARLDGFPLAAGSVHDWPMLSVEHLAQTVGAYLVAAEGDDVEVLVDSEVVGLTLGGRSQDELFGALAASFEVKDGKAMIHKKLPDYCYTAGTMWNGLPRLRTGYVPVMLTPVGQCF